MTNLVGYLGPPGSHTGAAAALLAPPGMTCEPCSSFVAVVEAIVDADVALGVLPIENSLHGPVGETHDLLYDAPLSIVGELTMPIVHCLVAKSQIAVEELTALRSIPVAFDQCRDLVHRLGIRCIPAASTSDAAWEVSESTVETEAAIASAEAAEHFGLTVIAEDVGDKPAAFTRFVLIAPYCRVDRAELWRTGLSFVTDHQPGSLYHALGPFQRHGLNLVQLTSRPIPRSTFRYRFDLVLDVHPQDHELQAALVEMRQWTTEVRIFGSYPASGDH